MKLKYINSDYTPKGQLIGFPLEVIDKMIEKQTYQGNRIDVKVFERKVNARKAEKGFKWSATEEGYDFWDKIINYKEFDEFFKKKNILKKRNSLYREFLKSEMKKLRDGKEKFVLILMIIMNLFVILMLKH